MALSCHFPSLAFFTTITAFTFGFVLLLGMHPLHGFPTDDGFYKNSCPTALDIIRDGMEQAVHENRRNAAFIVRLFFHDCFVHGCDGSILLTGPKGEQNAGPNKNSIKGMEIIDDIKSDLEERCKGVVSCADILAVAARDAVELMGGVRGYVSLGRNDSAQAYPKETVDIPAPSSDRRTLIQAFSKKGFTAQEMVALSGAHTIGDARCTVFRARIRSGKNIDPQFAKSVQKQCPGVGGDDNIFPLDNTNATFDSNYFDRLLSKQGLLGSDQELFLGKDEDTDGKVRFYRDNEWIFKFDFAAAMTKLGKLTVPGAPTTKPRSVCSKVGNNRKRLSK